MRDTREKLAEFVKAVVRTLPPEIRDRFPGTAVVQPAGKPEFGDFTTNICFRLASPEMPPRQVARIFLEEARRALPRFICRVEERNGFINFFLSPESVLEVIPDILAAGHRYGSSSAGNGTRVLVEFVSANPTGPLTIAHGRQAALGEAIARILCFAGYTAHREYYLNDSGRQMKLLGESLKARYEQIHGKDTPVPEDGYQGEYLKEIARTITQPPAGNDDFFRAYACEAILGTIRKDLADFGVAFDSWVNESAFHEAGLVTATIEQLKEKGLVYFQDGAWWFKSTSFGDEKDRVVVKSDGTVTYLLPDIVYHRNKISRGYHRLITLLGPDHHGYVPRLRAAVQALGFDPDRLQVIIVQLTTLYRSGEKMRMSTRSGEFITLRELIDEVGSDAAKFFFLFRRAESHLDFDLDVAKKRSLDNPVFYLQYAYVRLLHILEYAKEQGYQTDALSKADLSLLSEEAERNMAMHLGTFPDLVERVSRTLEVHLIAEYLLDLARGFHSYYHDHRIVGSNRRLSEARIALTQALLSVFSTALSLLNISLPDRM